MILFYCYLKYYLKIILMYFFFQKNFKTTWFSKEVLTVWKILSLWYNIKAKPKFCVYMYNFLIFIVFNFHFYGVTSTRWKLIQNQFHRYWNLSHDIVFFFSDLFLCCFISNKKTYQATTTSFQFPDLCFMFIYFFMFVKHFRL